MVHNWLYKPIGEVCKTTSGGTPSRSNTSFYDNGTIPWVKTGELVKKYLIDTEEKITQEAIQKSSAKIVPQNAVIMAMYGATIGKTSIIKMDMATNQACCAMITDEIDSHHEFLYYILSFMKDDIIALGAGGAQPNISQQVIKNIEIPVPPISEQRKISTILTSVDNTISKSEAVIEQTEKVKKGLMQQLFTKGIGNTKFKQTEIGEIPDEWDVRSFAELLSEETLEGIQDGNHGNSHPKSADYVDNGIPFIMANNLQDGNVDTLGCHFISKTQADNLRIGFSIEGDVLLSHKGTIGKTAIVPRVEHYIMLTPQVTYYRIKNTQRLLREYLKCFFDSEGFQARLKLLSAQSTRSYIGITNQKQLSIALPPLTEQRKIVEVVGAIDAKIRNENNRYERLQALKKGLMQVLLTGKVRVRVNDQEAVNT